MSRAFRQHTIFSDHISFFTFYTLYNIYHITYNENTSSSFSSNVKGVPTAMDTSNKKNKVTKLVIKHSDNKELTITSDEIISISLFKEGDVGGVNLYPQDNHTTINKEVSDQISAYMQNLKSNNMLLNWYPEGSVDRYSSDDLDLSNEEYKFLSYCFSSDIEKVRCHVSKMEYYLIQDAILLCFLSSEDLSSVIITLFDALYDRGISLDTSLLRISSYLSKHDVAAHIFTKEQFSKTYKQWKYDPEDVWVFWCND